MVHTPATIQREGIGPRNVKALVVTSTEVAFEDRTSKVRFFFVFQTSGQEATQFYRILRRVGTNIVVINGQRKKGCGRCISCTSRPRRLNASTKPALS